MVWLCAMVARLEYLVTATGFSGLWITKEHIALAFIRYLDLGWVIIM